MLLMGSWTEELYNNKEIWISYPTMCSLVYEEMDILREAQEALYQLQKEEESRQRRVEEEARLRLSQMKNLEVQEHPKKMLSHFR